MTYPKNSGFTLFEVLIASALIAVLFTGIVTFTTTLTHGITTAQNRLEHAERTYNAFQQIERDILAINHTLLAETAKNNSDIFKLSFYRTMPETGAYSQNGSTMIVNYWISYNNALQEKYDLPNRLTLDKNGRQKKAENEEKKVVLYRETFDPKFSEDGKKHILLEGKNIDISFKSKEKEIKTTWEGSEHPAQIIFNITDTLGRKWSRSIPVLVQESSR